MLWGAREWARVKANGDEYVQLVHDATNNEEKWGPTGPQMEAVCNAFPSGHASIMGELQWRLKHRDNAWRPCYKSLLVLDYLARNVRENLLPHISIIAPMLRAIATSFYYTNSNGEDHGVSVRERAKLLLEMLSDGALLREERTKAQVTKLKLAGSSSMGSNQLRHGHRSYGSGSPSSRGPNYSDFSSSFRPPPSRTPKTREEQEQMDMEFALRMQLEEERRTGVSAQQLEDMYARRVQQAKSKRPETDEECAARLQREEEELARRQGRSLPTLRSDTMKAKSNAPPTPAPTPTATPTPAPTAPALDDLFGPSNPVPAAPAAVQDPFAAFSAPAPAPAQQQHADPFGGPSHAAYNNSNSNPWGAPAHSTGAAPTQQGGAPNAWGASTAPADPWSAPAAPANPNTNPWTGSAPVPAASQQPSASNPWGAPAHSTGAAPTQQGGAPNAWGASTAPADPWSTPAAPANPNTNPWGSAPPNPSINNNNNNTAGSNDMWASLNRFANQRN